MRDWFRTRWAALNWFFRIILSVLGAFHTVAFLAAIIPGDWMAMLSAAGGLVIVYVIADWQYWETRGRIAGPINEFGALVAKELHLAQGRGHRIVTLRREGNDWTVYRNE